MTHLYMYRLTSDTGLAPCVKGKLLSLSVCKGGKLRNGKQIHTGMRYEIGSRFYDEYKDDEVYILGIYKNKLLYLARVTKVMTMKDYFKKESKGRMDDLYDVKDGPLHRNKHLFKEGVHTDEQCERDIAGEYVLLSEYYTYLGRDAKEVALVTKEGPKFRETKHYTGKDADKIINACKKVWDDGEHLPNSPWIRGCANEDYSVKKRIRC